MHAASAKAPCSKGSSKAHHRTKCCISTTPGLSYNPPITVPKHAKLQKCTCQPSWWRAQPYGACTCSTVQPHQVLPGCLQNALYRRTRSTQQQASLSSNTLTPRQGWLQTVAGQGANTVQGQGLV